MLFCWHKHMNPTSSSQATKSSKAIRIRSTLKPDGQLKVQRMSTRPPVGQHGQTANQPSRLHTVSVAEVMTTHVLCVAPEVEVDSLLALLVERGISGVPVVNERGLPIGMVSKTDIVRHLYEDGNTRTSEPATAGELMVPLAFTLLESASLSHATALMAWEGVHRLPICSDEGDVVGILSSLDVVRWLSREEGYPVRQAGPLSAGAGEQ